MALPDSGFRQSDGLPAKPPKTKRYQLAGPYWPLDGRLRRVAAINPALPFLVRMVGLVHNKPRFILTKGGYIGLEQPQLSTGTT